MARFPRHLRLVALGLFGALAFSATLAWAAPGVGLFDPPRTGYDPLSAEEQVRARALAFQHTEFAAAVNSASRSEWLLIERHNETKDVARSRQGPRRADVYVYLYDNDTLLHGVANLSSGRVDLVETAQGVQLPLTPNETSQAFQVLLADPAVMAEVAAQFLAITGVPLTDPGTQLQLSALIYRADSMPGANPGAADCGLHRCAQLLLATQDNVVINVLPIVDLSRGALVSAGTFVGN